MDNTQLIKEAEMYRFKELGFRREWVKKMAKFSTFCSQPMRSGAGDVIRKDERMAASFCHQLLWPANEKRRW